MSAPEAPHLPELYYAEPSSSVRAWAMVEQLVTVGAWTLLTGSAFLVMAGLCYTGRSIYRKVWPRKQAAVPIQVEHADRLLHLAAVGAAEKRL